MQLTAKQFTWNPQSKIASAMASDLQLKSGFTMLNVYNPKSNRVATFQYKCVTGDGEGDIHSWVFEGIGSKVQGWKLIVFND
jgi:hypothetical protein